MGADRDLADDFEGGQLDLADGVGVFVRDPGPGAGAGPSADSSGNGQSKKDEGVIDAEYVDVEDKK